jgi:hypothetical protein
MFQSIYDSPWVATFALAVVAIVSYAAWVRKQPFLVAYVGLCTLLAVGDALRSGSWSPLRLLGEPLEDQIGMVFVILGDYRFFLVTERYSGSPRQTIGPLDPTPRKVWLSALALTAIVPPIVYVVTKMVAPVAFAGRRTFLLYEVMFVVLALVMRFVVLPRRLAGAPDAVRRWLYEIAHFEIALYALWVIADVIIMAGADAGFALRIVPNVMYYGLFTAFVAFRAPREVRGISGPA